MLPITNGIIMNKNNYFECEMEILKCIKYGWKGNHGKLMTDSYFGLNTQNKINNHLEQLIDGGFIINKGDREGGTKIYLGSNFTLTHEGEIYLKNGGFHGQERKAYIQNYKDWLLIISTAAAGVEGILKLIEIIKHYL